MRTKITTEEFIKKAISVHGDEYDYSKTKYEGVYKKVTIICPIHGGFEQTPNNHLSGRGCHLCSAKKSAKTRTLSTRDFIERAQNVHGSKYSYSLSEYKGQRKKIKIICPEHGEFEQNPVEHWAGKGCPRCKSSKGEEIIFNFLEKSNIKFIKEKTFNNCKDKVKLRFDFYLPEHNMCIEFDGIGHYRAQSNWGGEKAFLKQKKRDKIKDQYCKNSNIKLIRIPYWDKENIGLILTQHLEGKIGNIQ